MSGLVVFLSDPVKYSKWYQHAVVDNPDSEGDACFDFSEAMIYFLSSGTSDHPTEFILYYMEGKKQVHDVILYKDMVYQMLNGVVYTNAFTTESDLVREANSIIPGEDLHIVSKTYYNIASNQDVLHRLKNANE